MYDDLRQWLTTHLKTLEGTWVARNASYEGDLCRILGMTEAKSRYWDASWRDYLLEFKKGRSIWLDLVRYSEVLLAVNPQAARTTLCLFFVPDLARTRILQVVGVETLAILRRLAISRESAHALLALHKQVPRSLNAQASLTVPDVKGIACFIAA